MFIEHYCKSPTVETLTGEIDKQIVIQPYNWTNYEYRNNTVRSQKYYTKWKRTDTQEQNMHSIIAFI